MALETQLEKTTCWCTCGASPDAKPSSDRACEYGAGPGKASLFRLLDDRQRVVTQTPILQLDSIGVEPLQDMDTEIEGVAIGEGPSDRQTHVS